MSNPLDISLSDLTKLAAAAGRQAGALAKRAGILPAGLLRVKWLHAAKKGALRRQTLARPYLTRISRHSRIARKAAGKRVA